MHLTNVDSIGHRKGATTDTLPYVEAARHAKDQVETLMRDLPDNTVLFVLSDHGHEPGGGSGGASDDARKTRMWVFQKALVDEGEDVDGQGRTPPPRSPPRSPPARSPPLSLRPGGAHGRPRPPYHHRPRPPPPTARPPAADARVAPPPRP